MYRLTNNPDMVFCEDTGVYVQRGNWLWDQYQLWLEEGNAPLPAQNEHGFEPHTPQHYRYIREQAFAWMRAEVNKRGYDSIETCVGYFNSGVDRYRLEARAMVAWRDAVNQALEALVLAPPAGVETWGQVKVLLPQPEQYDWPAPAELPLGGVPPVSLPLE